MTSPRPLWTDQPDARELLQSLADSPPPTRTVPNNMGGRDTVYCSTVSPNADRRVAELRAMYEAAFADALKACERGEITLDELKAIPDEQAAIRAAIAGKLEIAA